MTFHKRANRLRGAIRREKADALLVTDLTNIAYLAGFKGSFGLLLVTLKETIFLTDFRYIETAKKEVSADDVVRTSRNRFEDVKREIRKRKIRRLAFEPRAVSHADYVELAGKVGEKKLVPLNDSVERLRMIKDDEELLRLRKAVKTTDKSLRHIRRFLKPGVSEKELATELEVFFKLKGGEPGFQPIVAFGEQSSMPHHVSSNRRLKAGDMVLIDLGTSFQGYNADLTRTWLSRNMNAKEKEIYGIVLDAQQAAIDRVKPGVRLASIDAAARAVISSSGYGENFGHGLGHGIGLNVHELPAVSARSEGRCRKGMVFTIEPGIYIPEWGGVRIEDDVLVTGKGCEMLSSFGRDAHPFM